MGLTHAYSRVYKRSMTTQDTQVEVTSPIPVATVERLRHLLDWDQEAAEEFLLRNRERRETIAHIVRKEEEEYADFYRELGDR